MPLKPTVATPQDPIKLGKEVLSLAERIQIIKNKLKPLFEKKFEGLSVLNKNTLEIETRKAIRLMTQIQSIVSDKAAAEALCKVKFIHPNADNKLEVSILSIIFSAVNLVGTNLLSGNTAQQEFTTSISPILLEIKQIINEEAQTLAIASRTA